MALKTGMQRRDNDRKRGTNREEILVRPAKAPASISKLGMVYTN